MNARRFIASLPPALATRLEKAAADNGFDQELPGQGDWLGFASTHAPLRIWLAAIEHGPSRIQVKAVGGLCREVVSYFEPDLPLQE